MSADATTTTPRPHRGILATVIALPLVILLGLAGPAMAAKDDGKGGGPPGNNGTIKIDEKEFDSHPNNEPHTGCVFEVDFYGFDKGDNYYADVTFAAQPPTGNGQLLTDRVFIGEDDNSGGGSQAGLDAHKEYDLSSYLVGKFQEQPQQGYHVKLTINADGSQGADTKHKVFWVRGCTSTTNPNPNPNPNDNSNRNDSGVSPQGQPNSDNQSSNPSTNPSTSVNPSTAQPDTQVKGATVERQEGGAAAGPSSLARTGAEPLAQTGLGMLLIGAGQAVRFAARRRRPARRPRFDVPSP